MTFQDLFKKIQHLLYQLKPDATHFTKQIFLFGFTELADPDNEKQTVKGHFGQKSGLAKLFFPLVECYGLLASSQLHNLYSN